MNRIELPYTIVTYSEPVVTLTFKEGAHLDVYEVREMTRACEQIAGNKPYLLLCDARVFLNITSEGRTVAASKKEAPLIAANAVLVNNLPVRLTANFFIRFNKPGFKYRVFNSEKKAMEWLFKFDPRKIQVPHLRQ